MNWTRALWLPLLLCLTSPLGAQSLEVETEVTEELVAAASALIATLPQEPDGLERMLEFSRAEELSHEFDDEARLDWSYWPQPRLGLALGQMTLPQRRAVHDLLASVLSAKGYLAVFHIVQLEEVLRQLDGYGVPRLSEDYRLAFFGEPSASTAWAWRFEGHHVSINVTVLPGRLGVTPSFLGANPAEVRRGPLRGLRVLREEEERARALLASLDDRQRQAAIGAGAPPADVLSGSLGTAPEEREAWRDAVGAEEGITRAQLDPEQRAELERLLDAIVSTYKPQVARVARARLAAVSDDEVRFLWLGSTDPGAAHYYRITAGSFVFEYDNFVDDPSAGANHIHTVWRDLEGDFGADLLERHYREDHDGR